MEELTNDISGFVAPTDPETKHSYEYNVKSDLTFEICANFETTVNQEESKAMGMYDYYSPGYTPQNWAHTTGRVCFERTIDPDLYKIEDGSITKPQVLR